MEDDEQNNIMGLDDITLLDIDGATGSVIQEH